MTNSVGASLPGAAPESFRAEWEQMCLRTFSTADMVEFVYRLLTAFEASEKCKVQLRRELAAELQRGAALEAGPSQSLLDDFTHRLEVLARHRYWTTNHETRLVCETAVGVLRTLLAGEAGPYRDMMPRVMALVGGVLMLCNELERSNPGFPTIDGKRLRDMALEVRDSWVEAGPSPREPSEAAIQAALREGKLRRLSAHEVQIEGMLEAQIAASVRAAYFVDFRVRGESVPCPTWQGTDIAAGVSAYLRWHEAGDSSPANLVNAILAATRARPPQEKPSAT